MPMSEQTKRTSNGEEETNASSSANGSSSTLEKHKSSPPAKRAKTSESDPEYFEDEQGNLENENEELLGLVEDYSHHFVTSACYTKDDLTEWVKNIGKELGFTIIVGLHDPGGGKRTPRLHYVCERSGVYKKRIHEKDLKRKSRGTKKCDCPFKLKGNQETDDMWSLEVVCGRHNHPASHDFQGCAYAGKFSKEEEELVLTLSNAGSAPRDIFKGIKTELPDHYTNLRKIYNIRQKHRVLVNVGRSQMRYLLSKIQDNNYLEWHKTEKNGSNVVTDLFFAHRTSIDLLRTFPRVLMIDSTYKAIKYGMPLFEIVGITSTDITFCIAFAFIKSEKFENYLWALNCLKIVMKENDCELPSVMVTSKDLELVNAIESVFPDVRHMFCKGHISKHIIANTKKLFEDKKMFDKFLSFWNVVVQSDTEDELNSRLEIMRDMFKVYPAAIDYVEKSWVIPFSVKFVHSTTNKYMHYGNTTINRIDRFENTHSNLKRYIESSQLNIELFWGKVHGLLERQHSNVKDSFEKSKRTVQNSFQPKIFCEVRGLVALAALEIMSKYYQRGKIIGVNPLECGCVIRRTHGLPCAHEIAEFDKDNRVIPLAMVDDHWKKLSITTCTQHVPEEIMDEEFAKITSVLANHDEAARSHIIKKFSEIVNPQTSQLCGPKEKVRTVDRRKNDVDQSAKLKFSTFERVLSAENSAFTPCLTNSRTPGTLGSIGQSLVQVYTHPLLKKLPQVRTSKAAKNETGERSLLYAAHFPAYIQPFITTVDDVRSDGHCGYRAVSRGLFMHEDKWPQIRQELHEEITENIEVYANMYGSEEEAREVARDLFYFKMPALKQHWMTMPSLGCAIATKYNCIVYFLSLTTQCTFLPLRGGPPPMSERKEIGIGLINEDHFVHVKLTPCGPLPPIYPCWMGLKDDFASSWADPIYDRTNLFRQIKPPNFVEEYITVTDLDEN